MHWLTAVFFKRLYGEQNVTVQKNPLNCPQATLFDLMLTACDVVICHLLMDDTGPNCTDGEKAVKRQNNSSAFSGENIMKTTVFSSLSLIPLYHQQHQHYFTLALAGVQFCPCLARTSAWLICLRILSHSPIITRRNMTSSSQTL